MLLNYLQIGTTIGSIVYLVIHYGIYKSIQYGKYLIIIEL